MMDSCFSTFKNEACSRLPPLFHYHYPANRQQRYYCASQVDPRHTVRTKPITLCLQKRLPTF